MTNKTYDQIADQVNDELKKTENQTFGALSKTDKKLNLPSGTSFEMSGWSDYFEFVVYGDE
ncbi:hypothetical protein N9O40_00170 [Planktomarina sp.]|nr:hypothetical protein [Planktomarina sp.]